MTARMVPVDGEVVDDILFGQVVMRGSISISSSVSILGTCVTERIEIGACVAFEGMGRRCQWMLDGGWQEDLGNPLRYLIKMWCLPIGCVRTTRVTIHEVRWIDGRLTKRPRDVYLRDDCKGNQPQRGKGLCLLDTQEV